MMTEKFPVLPFSNQKGRTLNISFPLFSACNFSCEFCYVYKHGDKLTKEAFENALSAFADAIPARVATDGYEKILVRFYGGEIFADFQQEWVYNEYARLVAGIREASSVLVKAKFISNCSFTKWERAEKLLRETGAVLNMSYDPVGRYRTEDSRKTAIRTAQHFMEAGLLNEITTLLTKPNIEKIMNGDDFLKSIGSGIRIELGDYMPNPAWEKYMPSTEDLFRIYRWGIDNRLYHIDLFYDLMSRASGYETKIERACQCDDTLIYLPKENRFTSECIERNEYMKRYYGAYSDMVTEENNFEIKTSLMMAKESCTYCKYYSSCPMHCAAAVLFDGYDASPCPTMRLFDSVTKEDIKGFEEWRREHEDA